MVFENERLDLIQRSGYGIIQNKEWFSYGIDAVLISSFTKLKRNAKVVDLGTGTGIIPLLLHLKEPTASISAVEKQKDVAEMAIRSIKYNGIDKIDIIQTDVLNILEHIPKSSIDVVVSNPPYFRKGDALINDGDIKATSRHESTADIEIFIKKASIILKERGQFYMVHRPMRLVDIFYFARKYNLEPKEIQFVYPHTDKPPNIVLIKFVKNGNVELKYLENLYVYDEKRNYTEAINMVYNSLKIDVF